MNISSRIIIAIFSVGIAGIFALLATQASYGLEPTENENRNILKYVVQSIAIVSPLIVSALLPSKLVKLSKFFRWISAVLVFFPLLASANNTLQLVFALFKSNASMSGFIFGPIALILSFTIFVLLIWPEFKQLTTGLRNDAQNSRAS